MMHVDSNIQTASKEEIYQAITDELKVDPSDDHIYLALYEQYRIAVYPTNTGDDTRGTTKWFGQSYELLGVYSDADMRVAGWRAILRRVLERKNK